MDKINQLWIRACKTQDSVKRLKSVYRRYYGDYGLQDNERSIASILTSLVDEVFPMSISKFLQDKYSYNTYDKMYMVMKGGEETSEALTLIYIMRDRLRYTTKQQLIESGVTSPAKWRRHNE
jgi:hypothetical protein